MFSHIMLGADDTAAAKAFYDATLGTLGVRPGRTDDKGRVIYRHDGGVLMVSRPIDGQPACHANGGTTGFAASSPGAVDAWHAAGVTSGGTTCEDPPGVRDGAFGKLYLAYLRDRPVTSCARCTGWAERGRVAPATAGDGAGASEASSAEAGRRA